MLKNENNIVLFIGDSVTDCNRNRADFNCLGEGYVKLISQYLTLKHPKKNMTVLNRGVSGDRTVDMQRRLKEDCLDLNPQVVSILIGINDTWRRYDCGDETSVIVFEDTYRQILTQITEQLQAEIIMCEPFLLPVTSHQEQWREDLNPKIEVVRNLAKEFNATFIPLDELFTDAKVGKSAAYYAADGVHPSSQGHELIANAILSQIER
ncbi:MAG: SGNH/GDSL hydrolase family protein [Turicibacter sp.]